MIPDMRDTIVALSSSAGPGGRAVVRLSGPDAVRIASEVFTAKETLAAVERRRYEGHVSLPDVASPLPADLYAWPTPSTYTGQDLVELHTLSCPPLVDLLIARLLDAGARAAQRGEFTLRAFLAGKLDLPRAEAVLGVIEADTRDELKQALAQLAGGVSPPLNELRSDLLDLLADVEAGLDFAEEDVRFVEQKELLGRLAKGMALVTVVQKQLDQRAVDRRSYRVVLAGRPNAGKSSLFNALTGGTALVSAKPGTTRDYLTRRRTLGGVVVELIDTAGLREASNMIEDQAQTLGREQAARADLVLLCVEAGQAPTESESSLLRQTEPPVVAVATKCDLADAPSDFFATSAVTGIGLQRLEQLLEDRARNRPASPLAPSLSRCRHHLQACLGHLRQAHSVVLYDEPAELLAVELRGALDQLGEMVGAVYTDDLLDRIFSRFCIGK